MSRKIFVISDTHFGHENILTFKDDLASYIRPFESIEEMDELMVDNWNSVVRDRDIVYHIGDVFFGGGHKVLPRLKGRKRLVAGNHDNLKSPYIQNNFQKVMESRSFREFQCILTHRPIIIPHDKRFLWNVHGHIHGNTSPTEWHLNVSVEVIGYRPVELERLVSAAGALLDI